MDIKYIGKNIAKLHVARELTQGELGAKIGLTPSAISNIENATSYPSINTVILQCHSVKHHFSGFLS